MPLFGNNSSLIFHFMVLLAKVSLFEDSWVFLNGTRIGSLPQRQKVPSAGLCILTCFCAMECVLSMQNVLFVISYYLLALKLIQNEIKEAE